MQIQKGRLNLQKVLCKFYFRFDKILNEICEIQEEILKNSNFYKQYYEAQYKIKIEEIADNFFEKNNLGVQKNLKTLRKPAKKFLSKPE